MSDDFGKPESEDYPSPVPKLPRDSKGRISEAELKAILQAEKYDAMGSIKASHLSLDRSQAMKYFLGDMQDDLPPIEGRSVAVSMDVSDSVLGLMPSMMEIFCGSEQVVRFEPVAPNDVAQAEQETDYVNHVFMDVNQGYLVLYHIIFDALLSKVGIAKVHWHEAKTTEKDTYYDQDDMAYAAIINDPDVEVTEHSERQDPIFGTMHDVTIERTKNTSYCRIDPVPPEEFGISRRARMNMQDTSYMFHEVIRRQADLIADGFDPMQVDSLSTYNDIPHAGAASEIYARDTVFEYSERDGDEALNRAMRPIRVTEHYIRMDYEGDNDTRLYRCTTAGEDAVIMRRDGELDIVEMEWFPFAAITPFIQTHRFFGRSIADLTMDLQRINTVLTRGFLDNSYQVNSPRIEVPEAAVGPNTLDDMMVSRPGGLIRTRQGGMLNAIQIPYVGDKILPALEYFNMVREWRTGVSRTSQGIDADALQNQSATAVNQVYNASQAKMKFIARTFAETGLRDLFWLVHNTIRKYGDRPETIRVRGQWVSVDPRKWKARDDITVHVGLGSGGRAEKIQEIMMIGNVQERMLMGGITTMVTPKNLYNAAEDLSKAIGVKDLDRYFTDPGNAPFPPPQPDPKAQQLQMQAQMQAANDQRQAQLEQAQAQKDMEVQQQKAQTEAQLAREKFELERQLKILEFRMKEQEMQHTMTLKDRESRNKISENSANGEAKRGAQEVVITGGKRTMDGVAKQMTTGFKMLSDQIQDSHKAQLAAHKEVVKAAKAPRKTELVRDEKTKRVKGAISKVED